MDGYRLPIRKQRDLLTLCSGPETRNGVQIRAPAKLGVPGDVYPEIKGPWLLIFENVESRDQRFFCLSYVLESAEGAI